MTNSRSLAAGQRRPLFEAFVLFRMSWSQPAGARRTAEPRISKKGRSIKK
jgi:hypothetical protein